MIGRRAFALLSGAAALSACAGPYTAPLQGGYGAAPLPGEEAAARGQGVAALLPLSGPMAGLGAAMRNAISLALDSPEAPHARVIDTAGTPPGAAAAAHEAINNGAGLLLGPLTAEETAAAAPVAQAGGAYMLAFTSDPTQTRPGVWTLGITPDQQVLRMAQMAQAQGRTRFAGLLPETEFGRLLAEALQQTAGAFGAPAPIIRYYPQSFAVLNDIVREMSDYADRRGPLDAEIRAAKAGGTAAGFLRARELERQPVPPPPFDALLLGDGGLMVAELATFLPYYDIGPPEVQVMGPAFWNGEAANLATNSALVGAWYAAPDPYTRAAFIAGYGQRFGSRPPFFADLAFDAAAIARVLATGPGFRLAALTAPRGFIGADGVFALAPDGQVRRGLALFAVEPGGGKLISPAPTTLAT